MIIILSFQSATGTINSTRTSNPAKAYTIAKRIVENMRPCNITFWCESEVENLSIPYNYIVNSISNLNTAMESITLNMARKRVRSECM